MNINAIKLYFFLEICILSSCNTDHKVSEAFSEPTIQHLKEASNPKLSDIKTKNPIFYTEFIERTEIFSDQTMARIRKMRLFSTKHCTSLYGIQYFKKLEVLEIYRLQVEDLEWIKNLHNLKQIFIYDTPIKNIEGLRKLKNLQDLAIFSDSRLKINIDLSPLENLKKLQSLGIEECQIKELETLSKLKTLKHLSLNNTKINNLTPILELKKLESLSLSNNRIADLNSISKLQKLWMLDLSKNDIKNIDSLSKLNNLRFLNLSSNQIKELSPIYELKKIEDIYLKDNPIPKEQKRIFIQKLNRKLNGCDSKTMIKEMEKLGLLK